MIGDNISLASKTSYSEQNRYRITDASGSNYKWNPFRITLSYEDNIFQRSFFQVLKLKEDYEKYKWIIGDSIQKTTKNFDRLGLILPLNLALRVKIIPRAYMASCN